MKSRPIGVDLFAGAGGMSLGFEQAGFDVRAAVEIDPVHCATHERNFPHTATICKSVTRTSGKEIRKLAGLGNSVVDVVFGGAPCQGFSMIGQRALDDPRNQLVNDFVRVVVELEARYFVFENVKGITVGKHRQFLDELMATFDAAGYDVLTQWRVLNAAEFGVPQDRQRLFLIGCRRGETLPSYPRPQTSRGGKIEGTEPTPTCAEALGDLPDAEQFPDLLDSDTVSARLGNPSAYAAALRGLSNDPDRAGFEYSREWDPSLLTSSLRTDHTPLSRKRFAETNPGTVEPVSRFFKLAADGISNTLRAGTDSQRGAFTSPRPIHFEHARCVTVREMARLHGYPDWFRFHVTKWHGARQIGNSVPPPLARAVASQIMKALGRTPIRPAGILKLGPDRLLAMNMEEAATHFEVSRYVIPQRRRTDAGKDVEALDRAA